MENKLYVDEKDVHRAIVLYIKNRDNIDKPCQTNPDHLLSYSTLEQNAVRALNKLFGCK